MAGLGRKTWSAGEVATAANIQGYLQDQVVMKFANTAAAGSALGTAVSEGMTAYLSDTDELVLHNGTSWFKQNGTTNAIINGAFDFWQRGTSFTNPTDGAYTADRWFVAHNSTGATRTVSQQTFTPGTAPVAGYEGTYFLRNQVTVAGTGATYHSIQQKIEDVRSFAGQTVTVSFWAKAEAARTSTFGIYQNFGSGGSASVYPTSASISLTASWARYTASFAVPSISGKTIGTGSFLALAIDCPLNAISTTDIWGVQLEAGSVATPFKRNAPSIQAELAACERYMPKWGGNASYEFIGSGVWEASSSRFIVSINHPVTLRSGASSVEFSNLAMYDGSTFIAVTSASVIHAGLNTTFISTAGGSSGTSNRPYWLVAYNSTSAYLRLPAEL